MTTFNVAHLHEQGQDIIIVLVNRQVSQAQCNALQAYARSAGLAGIVVPVWRQGFGFGFLAPNAWFSFFRSLSWEFICRNVNRTLTCM